jgi:hypothetical protein
MDEQVEELMTRFRAAMDRADVGTILFAWRLLRAFHEGHDPFAQPAGTWAGFGHVAPS